MGLKYREDKHLEFLSTLSNEELDVLVKILTSTFTNDLDIEERYKKYYPNHKKYWNLIAADYQHFGEIHLLTFSEAVFYMKKF